jgi:hypothetical protein
MLASLLAGLIGDKMDDRAGISRSDNCGVGNLMLPVILVVGGSAG